MNEEERVQKMVDSLLVIFSTESPAFAMTVLSITTGIVVGHCMQEFRAGMLDQHMQTVNTTIDAIQGPPKNETH
jgi:hypothetical protein